jgi:hypothetical protein
MDTQLYPLAYSGGGVGLKSVGVLAQGNVGSSVTGTNNLTALATIELPALGPNALVRILMSHTLTNNADAKTVGVAIDGTSVASYSVGGSLTSSVEVRIGNRGATNSQLVTPPTIGTSFGQSATAFPTPKIDLSVPTTLTLYAQLTTTTDEITLESYCVEILNP